MRTIKAATLLVALLVITANVNGKVASTDDVTTTSTGALENDNADTAFNTAAAIDMEDVDMTPGATDDAAEDTESPVSAGSIKEDADIVTDAEAATATAADPGASPADDQGETHLFDDPTTLDDDPVTVEDDTTITDDDLYTFDNNPTTWTDGTETGPPAQAPTAPPPTRAELPSSTPSPAFATTTTVPHPTPTNVQSFANPLPNAAVRVRLMSPEGLTVGMFAGVIAILL